MAQAFAPSAFENSAFEVGYNLNLAQGSYTLTGRAASVTHASMLPAAQGTFTVTGNANSWARTYVLAGSAGSYSVGPGTNDNVVEGHAVLGEQGVYAITGNADGGLRYSYAQSTGVYTITGSALTFLDSHQLFPATGSYAIDSVGISLEYTGHYQVGANAGSYTITGRNAGFFLLRALNGDSGQFTITPGTRDVSVKGYRLSLTKGVYAFTGGAANFFITMPADKGTYAFTGYQVARNITRLPLLSGSFTLTGNPAFFVIGMPANKGAFAVTGFAPDLRATRRSPALNLTYPVTGFDTDLIRSNGAALSKGTFTITGNAISGALVRRLNIPTASYTVSGNTVAFGQIRGFACSLGRYDITLHLQGFVGARLSFTDGHDTTGGDLSPRTIIIAPVNRVMEIA